MLGAPDATAVRSLLQNPKVRIMSFPTAEAFTIIFPELVRLVLPRGVIDIDRNIPPTDVPLIGSTAKVLVRSDLHPEIVQLLLQMMVEAHGARAIFQRSGEFPRISHDRGCRIGPDNNDVWHQCDQLLSGNPHAFGHLARETIVKSDVAAFGPAKFVKTLPESREIRLHNGFTVIREGYQ
jgi:hypothetical protein